MNAQCGEDVLHDAATGCIVSQRMMRDGFVSRVCEGAAPDLLSLLKAEHWGRLVSAHGGPDDREHLARILGLQASLYPRGHEWRERLEAEAIAIVGDGDTSAVKVVTDRARHRAAILSRQIAAMAQRTVAAEPMERTKDSARVEALIAEHGDPALRFDFNTEAWLENDDNVALVSGDNLALFASTAPGVFDAHWLLAARGRAALSLGKSALQFIFTSFGGVVRGLTPITCPRAAWFNRQLGGKSLGIISTVHGEAELFVLAPGIIEGNVTWDS